MGKTRNQKKKGETRMSRKKTMGNTKNIKKKTCRCSEKTKEKKGAKTKAWKKRKKGPRKGRHGPAYYFVCFNAIKKFVSRTN